jgi:hypothetical protein
MSRALFPTLTLPALTALLLASGCDFATGAACESDDNCPEQAPFCVDIVDGVGSCTADIPADAGPRLDAGQQLDAGVDAGGDDDGGADDAGDNDAGDSDAGGNDAGDIDAGPSDGGADAGDAGPPDPCDSPAPDAGVLVPTIGFWFPRTDVTTDEPLFRVRGQAYDPTRVCSVDVNGVQATYEASTREWIADLPLTLGDNELVVTVNGPPGRSLTQAGATVKRVGALLSEPRGAALVLGPGGQTVVAMADNATSHVYGLDVSTLQTVYLSGSRRGAGPLIGNPRHITGSMGGSVYYVTNAVEIARIDADTGDRTLLASDTVGTGAFGTFEQLAMSDDGQAVFIFDSNAGQILRMDVVTRARTVVSSGAQGGGPTLQVQGDFTVMGDTPYVATHSGGFTILAIDPSTGDRSVLSSDGVGTGPIPQGGGPLYPNTGTANELLMISSDGQLYSINVADGSRNTIVDVRGNTAQRNASGLVADGTHVYVVDTLMEAVHVVGRSPLTVELHPDVAGSGMRLDDPDRLALSSMGDLLYVSTDFNRVYRVVVDGGDRAIYSGDLVHGDGYSYGSIDDLALDDDGDLLVVDATNHAIWRVPGATRAVWAANSGFPAGSRGTGTSLDEPIALARGDLGHGLRQATNDRFVTIDSGAVRTLVSTSIALESIGDIAYSFAGGYYYATQPNANAILQLDGASTSILSDNSSSGDAIYGSLRAIHGNTDGLWVLNGSPEAIIEVDVTDGSREYASAQFMGNGPMFGGGRGLIVEGQNAYVVSQQMNAVIVVDTATGERAVVSQ